MLVRVGIGRTGPSTGTSCLLVLLRRRVSCFKLLDGPPGGVYVEDRPWVDPAPSATGAGVVTRTRTQPARPVPECLGCGPCLSGWAVWGVSWGDDRSPVDTARSLRRVCGGAGEVRVGGCWGRGACRGVPVLPVFTGF